MTYSSDPESAYLNLNLARMFWCLAKNNDYIDIVKSNIDEGFDAYALLPEAASLLITKDKNVKDSNKQDDYSTNRPIINSVGHISTLLVNVSNFIEYISNSIKVEKQDNHDNRIHSLRLHRFLPSLCEYLLSLSSILHSNNFIQLELAINMAVVLQD